MVSKKKLIYILNSYSSDESSHFYHIINLLEELAKQGVEIALIIEKAYAIPNFDSRNIRVIALKRRWTPLRLAELFAVVRQLIRVGFDKTFVRISAPATLAAIAAHRIYGGATFLWQSGTTIEYDAAQKFSYKKIKWYLASHIPNVLARKYVHHFVTGPSAMIDYYEKVGGVKREKTRLLYNDIDIERFRPVENRFSIKADFLAQHGFHPDTLLLLLVHRLSPVRRTVLYFPFCLAHLRDAGLVERVAVVVAGEGVDLSLIKTELMERGLSNRCIFLGNVPNRKVQQLYAIADIFLHPTYNEGFPRVILEAMAASLPIVSTDAGGTRELMGDLQSKFVVKRDNPESFALCLQKMVSDPDLREKISEENRRYVERFSTSNVAAMYQEVLFK